MFDSRQGGSYPDTIKKGGETYRLKTWLQWSQGSLQMRPGGSSEVVAHVYDRSSGKRVEIPATTGRSGENGKFGQKAPPELKNKKFTVKGGVVYVQEEAEMDMSNVSNYSHKVVMPGDEVPIYAVDEAEAKRIASFEEGAQVVKNIDTEWPQGVVKEDADGEVALEAMLPWHGDDLVESF